MGYPFFVGDRLASSPHTAPLIPSAAFTSGFAQRRPSTVPVSPRKHLDVGGWWDHTRQFCYQMEQCGGLWGKVADNGATGAPSGGQERSDSGFNGGVGGGGGFLGPYTRKSE